MNSQVRTLGKCHIFNNRDTFGNQDIDQMIAASKCSFSDAGYTFWNCNTGQYIATCKYSMWLSPFVSKNDRMHNEKECHSERSRGIYAFGQQLQSISCQDPSTRSRSLRMTGAFAVRAYEKGQPQYSITYARYPIRYFDTLSVSYVII